LPAIYPQSGAGFSLRVSVLARTKTRRLKPAPLCGGKAPFSVEQRRLTRGILFEEITDE
jgi:hypothetical protein